MTAPLVAAPFALWAWRELRRAKVPAAPVGPGAAALFPVATAAVHTAASSITSGSSARRRRPIRSGSREPRS